MIFQEPMTSLNPLHTIEKQVGEVLKLHRHMDDADAHERVLELLRKVGIREPEKRLDAYPHQLSGGQRQRVMIAMALANEPDLLIADEPTTALDVTIQAQILELLRQLQREMGMAMLLITHDLGIVRKMAERVYIMQGGKIVETGATEEIFTAPKHAYTRQLLAAEPKGIPPAANDAAPVVVETDDLEGLVPDQEGRAPPHGRLRQGRRRALAQAARRPDARRRRQIGLRQDDARSRHHASHLVARSDRLRRQAHRRPQRARDAPAAQGHADRLPGSLRLALAAPVGRPDHRGRAC